MGLLSRSTIALSGLSVVAGVVFILLGERGRHRAAMLTAAAFAVVFLVLYIIKSSLFPFQPYRGAYRTLFHFILWSHTFLSLVNLPLAVVTIYLALKKRFERHRRIAPYTAGVWIYVAGSGWLVFLFNG
ncbi:MAG: DUF420 domain-containing protein [Thermodesulfobacteriota bacterium]